VESLTSMLKIILIFKIRVIQSHGGGGGGDYDDV
jgi:hypothetical protein